jgi:hypothetical protein
MQGWSFLWSPASTASRLLRSRRIESLVPGQTDRVVGSNSVAKALEIEVKQLAKADLVVCISREEQWLLNAFGIAADCLPYFPTADTP